MNSIRINRFARFVPGAFTWVTHARVARKIVQVAVPGLFLLLTACGGNMEEPKIELNPHPAMHYALAVVIDGAPGAFDSVDASADYGVTDYGCVPEQPVSGARHLPGKHVPLRLVKASDTTYTTEIYVDLLKDEDYFGKGVCHWKLAGITAEAAKRRMRFITPVSARTFSERKSETRYFSFDAYYNDEFETRNMGNRDRHAYPDSHKTFSISVTAKEMQP